MKSVIQYLDFETNKLSNCGDPLEIEVSSRNLNWNGVLLEKGWSPHFYPKNIITESFYFALSISSPTKWKTITEGKIKEIKTEPGEVWLNPPNTPFTHDVNDACFFIILLISERELYACFDEKLPDQKLSFLNQYNVSDSTLTNIIQLFYEEVKNEGRNGKIYLDTLKKLLSNYFLKNYSDYDDLILNKKSTTISESMLNTIKEYVTSNLEEDISIDTLSFKMGLSKFYFLREFKKATGITPYQYILKLKLEKAEELLRKTGKSLIEISLELGFSDQSHFTRTFSNKYGVSPKRYKSNFLQ